MREIESTVTGGEMEWRSPAVGYPGFIEKVLADYFSQRTQRTVVVFLWDNITYIRTILEKISEKISPDLAHYVFTSTNDEKLLQLRQNMSGFEQASSFCNISLNEVCGGLESLDIPDSRMVKCLQVPGMYEEREQIMDITPLYAQYRDAGLEPLYIGIEQEEQESDADFYAGGRVTWMDLSLDKDVRRNTVKSFGDNISDLLRDIRGSEQYTLYHDAGAGGSTLARRIAYNFHDNYPTVLITKYCRLKDKTRYMLFDFASRTQKTMLAVVEAYQVNQNDLKDLIRKCNQAAKRILFIYVKHGTPRDNAGDQTKRSYLKATMGSREEQLRFAHTFKKIAVNQQNIHALEECNYAACEVLDFALSANESKYNTRTLGNYILAYMTKLPEKQKEFAIFSAMQYFYTQKPVSETVLRSLFSPKGLTYDLSASADEEYIRKLLTQEYDKTEPSEYWRPRYNRFAIEILRIGLMGKAPNDSTADDWKSMLADWSIKYIQCCKDNNYDLTDEIEELLRSLFLERNNEDFLQADDRKKFAQIIDDIKEIPRQSEVLETLVRCYPDNHHFRGHWARFLYETANDLPDYDKAAEEIEKTIDSGNETDYILWHLGGMCRKRKINFLIERYKSDPKFHEENPDIEDQVQTLTEEAFYYYTKSRAVNARNLYVHSAAIGLLLDILDFGRFIQGNPSKDNFLADKGNWWYTKQFENLFELLDEAKYIIEESTNLDSQGTNERDRQIIAATEGRIYELIGDYHKSTDIFSRLAETSNMTMRPYFRKLYIYSSLLSKVNNRNELSRAWRMLNKSENATLMAAVEKNITDQPDNVGHIKDWLRLVRYSSYPYTCDYAINKMQRWYDRSNGLSRLEASYYLYVLNACKAISAGDSFSRYNVNEAKRYIEECKKYSVNDYHSFEWLGKESGMKSLISHKNFTKRPPFFQYSPTKSPLRKVKGIITHMESNRKGTIQLDCGLEAYFVPVVNNLFIGKDETGIVECYISFRYSGLQAWNVKRITDTEESWDVENLSDDESADHSVYSGENLDSAQSTEIKSIRDTETEPPKEKLFSPERSKMTGPKIIGYMDPETLKKKR